MKTQILLDSWNRKEHFHFFASMAEPFFGVVVEVEVSSAYAKAKAMGVSFFQYYLYQSLKAANQVENFRYRIEDGKVFCYDVVHASATIGREDGTFGFSFIEYIADFQTFTQSANAEIAAVQQTTGLRFNDDARRIDCIHYSAVPWLRFTSLTHARSFTYRDSAPKISFGKYHQESDKMSLPVAIYVNHALMDAYHVGQFVEKFQHFLNE